MVNSYILCFIIRRYMEMDIQLYEKCSRENNEKTRKLESDRETSQQKWNIIIESATASGIDISKLWNNVSTDAWK